MGDFQSRLDDHDVRSGCPRGNEVAADGIHDVPSEKMRSINPQACHPATMGGSGTSAMNQANFSMICE